MLDEEWCSFLNQEEEAEEASPFEETVHQIDDSFHTVNVTPLYISTTTKIAYLKSAINLASMFWQLELQPYSEPNPGLIKKQMKFNSHSVEEFQKLNDFIVKEKGYPIVQDVIYNLVNDFGRIKFKDIRKLSVGFCSKDAIMKTKCKSAFYNCFVMILRLRQGRLFKEYHVKVFNTGKMEIPGIQNDSEFQFVLENILQILQTYDSSIEMQNSFDTILINSNFKTGFYINRDNLYEILQREYHMQCVYDPCSYPGIQCKFYYYKDRDIQTGVQNNEDIKGKGYGYKKQIVGQVPVVKNKMSERKNSKFNEVSIMIFRTGSVLIVGMCSEAILSVIYEFLKTLMQKEYHRIKQNNMECEPSVSENKKKAKKKIIKLTS
jgi:TATA-box binding protein (TBP) (component of TFIID and TFIIIB)